MKNKHKVQTISKTRLTRFGLYRKALGYLRNIWLGIKIFLVILLILYVYSSWFATTRMSVKQRVADWTANFGFVLKQVTIEGQHQISIEPILEQFASKPIFSLDLKEIQRKLQEHPWIREAIIVRRLPDALHIKITEKQAIAIWQYNRQLHIIDQEGAIIPDQVWRFSHLLQVVGLGANTHAKQLLDELATIPELASKLRAAKRQGERRWDLIFADNIVVKMPENNFQKAWQYLNKFIQEHDLLTSRDLMLDLRDHAKHYILDKTQDQ